MSGEVIAAILAPIVPMVVAWIAYRKSTVTARRAAESERVAADLDVRKLDIESMSRIVARLESEIARLDVALRDARTEAEECGRLLDEMRGEIDQLKRAIRTITDRLHGEGLSAEAVRRVVGDA